MRRRGDARWVCGGRAVGVRPAALLVGAGLGEVSVLAGRCVLPGAAPASCAARGCCARWAGTAQAPGRGSHSLLRYLVISISSAAA